MRHLIFMFFSNKTWRPSPISIPPFKTTQTQLQPHWFTNNVFFLDLFGTPSYTPQCNCMEKCLTNQCPKHAATCQLTRPLWFSVVVMLTPWMDAYSRHSYATKYLSMHICQAKKTHEQIVCIRFWCAGASCESEMNPLTAKMRFLLSAVPRDQLKPHQKHPKTTSLYCAM